MRFGIGRKYFRNADNLSSLRNKLGAPATGSSPHRWRSKLVRSRQRRANSSGRSSRSVVSDRDPLTTVWRRFPPKTSNAKGMVVRAPNRKSVQPIARRWSSCRRLANKRPTPAPRAARVPATRANSGKLIRVSLMTIPPDGGRPINANRLLIFSSNRRARFPAGLIAASGPSPEGFLWLSPIPASSSAVGFCRHG